MNNQATTVLLCGVGGQGTILAADILAGVCMAQGLDVKVSEIHGMAQRGGAVTTVVRFGQNVNSMACSIAEADFVYALETTEALRNISFLKPGGVLLVSDETIKTLPAAIGKDVMPKNPKERLNESGAIIIPAKQIAVDAGTEKASNIALLGALSVNLRFDENVWIEVLNKRIPQKYLDINLKAFNAGREAFRQIN